MTEKKLPFASSTLIDFAKRNGTPFHIYDGRAIRKNAENMLSAFSWSDGFINYFAVKALPNVNILRLLASAGFGADCSSLPELISFRYNPGSERTGNAIIGNPVEAKYGVPHRDIIKCYEIARDNGVKRFMLHTMVASNELEEDYIVETARMLFSLVAEIHDKTGIKIERIDLGGGIGIPYRPEDTAISFDHLSKRIHELYEEMIEKKNLAPLKLSFECGRCITGQYGYLVSKVRHVTHKYKDYVGLDATMADLMRPAMYGAYHHITVLGKEDILRDHIYDVTGSLCENNDKFAVDRALPEIDEGDYIVIHDTGAHGHSMGFNYNAKLRHAEYLILDDGIYRIRRDETYEDYIRTMLSKPEKITNR